MARKTSTLSTSPSSSPGVLVMVGGVGRGGVMIHVMPGAGKLMARQVNITLSWSMAITSTGSLRMEGGTVGRDERVCVHVYSVCECVCVSTCMCVSVCVCK